jgi:hypothetical protein
VRTFQIVASPDIVDVLRHEHEQIRRRCVAVQQAGPGHRKHPLAALRQAVRLHQLGERAVAHPAVRNSGPEGDAIALGLQIKSEQLYRSLTELSRLGGEHPDFRAGFAAVCEALHEHASSQERDELPLLRRHVPAQRLHMMASAMQDVQIMAGG